MSKFEKVKDFFVRLWLTICCLFSSNKLSEEDQARSKVNKARKEKRVKRNQEHVEMWNRILNYEPHKLPSYERPEEQIATERDWAVKAVKLCNKLPKNASITSLDDYPRYFEVEVEAQKYNHHRTFKAYAYAYVECRDTTGACVFVYTPGTFSKEDEYKVYHFYGGSYYELSSDDTIALAMRLFAPLFGEDEAA